MRNFLFLAQDAEFLQKSRRIDYLIVAPSDSSHVAPRFITRFALAGSHDPEPTPLRLLLQLPTEEPAGVQACGAPLPQNGVRDSPHVQRGHLQ